MLCFSLIRKNVSNTYKISTNDLILSFSHRNDRNLTQNAKKTPAYLSFLLVKVNKQKENVIFQTTQLDFFLEKKKRGTSLILPKTDVILTFTEMPEVPMKKVKL